MTYAKNISYKLATILIAVGALAVSAQAGNLKIQRSVIKPSIADAKRDCERRGGRYVRDKRSKTGYSCRKGRAISGTRTKPVSRSTRKKPSPPRRLGIRNVRLSPTGVRSVKGARLVPGAILATMEVSCRGGKTFTISTGGAGSCSATIAENGNVAGGSCQGGGVLGGGDASVDCSANSGQGACTGSSGSGSCGETRP